MTRNDDDKYAFQTKDVLFCDIFLLAVSRCLYFCMYLVQDWHVYTGSSCFVLDPFGFQGILNVNFIEKFFFFLLAVGMQNWRTCIFTLSLMRLCVWKLWRDCCVLCIICYDCPHLWSSGILVPIPCFILWNFSATFPIHRLNRIEGKGFIMKSMANSGILNKLN